LLLGLGSGSDSALLNLLAFAWTQGSFMNSSAGLCGFFGWLEKYHRPTQTRTVKAAIPAITM
jgi:hypothetical protein